MLGNGLFSLLKPKRREVFKDESEVKKIYALILDS